MYKKFILLGFLLTFLLVAGLTVVPHLYITFAAKPVISSDLGIWELSNARIVDPGDTIQTNDGMLIAGYIMEARAKPKGNNLASEGLFRLKVDIFSPRQDTKDHKIGMWYIKGSWSITQIVALTASVRPYLVPDPVEGKINDVLTFNPLEDLTHWGILYNLPMSLASEQ